MSKQPAQPGQPAHVRPTATRSNNFGGRTRVPTFLTWPQWVGSGFPLSKHVKLDLPLSFNLSSDLLSIPNQIRWNLAEICQDLVQTLQDSARSCLCSMKSRPDLDRSGQILPDLARYWQIQPNIDPGDKIRDQLNKTRNRRDPNWKIRPDHLGQFRVIFSVVLKTEPDRQVQLVKPRTSH